MSLCKFSQEGGANLCYNVTILYKAGDEFACKHAVLFPSLFLSHFSFLQLYQCEVSTVKAIGIWQVNYGKINLPAKFSTFSLSAN